MRPALTIDSTDAVQRFRPNVWRVGPRRYSDVKVAIPDLSADDNTRYTMQLRGLYFACGCNEGKVAAVLAFIVALIATLRSSGGFSGLGALGVVTTLAVTALGALAGKFAALAAARRILGRTLDRLETDMNAAAREDITL